MKMTLKIVAASFAASIVLLSGCGGKKDTAGTDAKKVLKVGTEPTFAPFEFQEKDSKDFTGFDTYIKQQPKAKVTTEQKATEAAPETTMQTTTMEVTT